jgi:hypothetical protein
MDRDEIIRMAREAGLPYEYDTGRILYLKQLERFAALVIEQEHKRLLEGSGEPIVLTESNDGTPTAYTADQMAAAVIKERERCAAIAEAADPMGSVNQEWMKERIAAAIRGQA